MREYYPSRLAVVEGKSRVIHSLKEIIKSSIMAMTGQHEELRNAVPECCLYR